MEERESQRKKHGIHRSIASFLQFLSLSPPGIGAKAPSHRTQRAFVLCATRSPVHDGSPNNRLRNLVPLRAGGQAGSPGQLLLLLPSGAFGRSACVRGMHGTVYRAASKIKNPLLFFPHPIHRHRTNAHAQRPSPCIFCFVFCAFAAGSLFLHRQRGRGR